MLQSLHVKNLALIDETEITFQEGLNILTGETGAGKSIVIGSINLALGGKFDKDLLRTGTENALVELSFTSNPKVSAKLKELEIEEQEDGLVLLSRKLSAQKSVLRINGEAVSLRQVKELAEDLIDIHGQHEHQSLLHKKNYLGILDGYCAQEIEEPLNRVREAYRECSRLRKALESENVDETTRRKEQALAEFEVKEIEEARLVPGEDEELEKQFKRMSNAKKIAAGLMECHRYVSQDSEEGAGNGLSRAIRAISGIAMYDDTLEQLKEQLIEIDGLLSDFSRETDAYLEGCEYEEEQFYEVETRLNLINHLKEKYGATIEEVLRYAEEQNKLLIKYANMEAYLEELQQELSRAQDELKKNAEILTKLRTKGAEELSKLLKKALIDLNFLSVAFQITVKPLDACGENGCDDIDFLISTNPGEPIKPLSQVASGGELSRVMLALKTVLAGKDEIDTLIFDEIDTGISGKTAWRVSQKLREVACRHQVICITHLPQIAAMNDQHFLIEKTTSQNVTVTQICPLTEEESLKELARLLGGDGLSESALINAGEIRNEAIRFKTQE